MSQFRRPMFGSRIRSPFFGGRSRKALRSLAVQGFPTAGVLDNFNRADESPLAAATWNAAFGEPTLKVLTNVCGNDVSPGGMQIWANQFTADQEVFFTVSTVPANTGVFTVAVRNQSATIYRTFGQLIDTYFAEFSFPDAVTNGVVKIFRQVEDVTTQLGANISLGVPMAAAQVLGLRVKGSVLTVWRDGIELDTQTDTNITAAGNLVVVCSDTTMRFDNFGGGAI